ncbi:hypothetical protein JF544_06050 [Halobacillus kuroshimensis]|uniref:Uncharacterized protein n=1 Tax=Halobacillus kuroshimensis TaxID=302481 RepID=A0ABS3DTZ6_9BACI|nr:MULTISPECIES: hypothetical protein [Halobacillus]MBN8234801.1 hypothetical protein [Halobacillus kuroshimensis]
MDILNFIKEEGFTSARFQSFAGKDTLIQLNRITDMKELFGLLDMNPTTVRYYPYEKLPYLDCSQNEDNLKLRLFKP